MATIKSLEQEIKNDSNIMAGKVAHNLQQGVETNGGKVASITPEFELMQRLGLIGNQAGLNSIGSWYRLSEKGRQMYDGLAEEGYFDCQK